MASIAATSSFAFSLIQSSIFPKIKSSRSESFVSLNFKQLKQNNRKINVVRASSAPGLYSAEQFELTSENVDKVLDGVRPYLISDGGNVDVVSVDNGVVSLKLLGTPIFVRPCSFMATQNKNCFIGNARLVWICVVGFLFTSLCILLRRNECLACKEEFGSSCDVRSSLNC